MHMLRFMSSDAAPPITHSADASGSVGNRIFIANIPYNTTLESLEGFLSTSGFKPSAVSINVDRFGRPRGSALADFDNMDSVRRVVETVNGKDFGGRAIIARPFTPRTFQSGSAPEGGAQDGSDDGSGGPRGSFRLPRFGGGAPGGGQGFQRSGFQRSEGEGEGGYRRNDGGSRRSEGGYGRSAGGYGRSEGGYGRSEGGYRPYDQQGGQDNMQQQSQYPPRQRVALAPATGKASTPRVFLSNLSFDITWTQIKDYFRDAGINVEHVKLFSTQQGNATGRAVVHCGTVEAAQLALDTLNSTQFLGRTLFIREELQRLDGSTGAPDQSSQQPPGGSNQ